MPDTTTAPVSPAVQRANQRVAWFNGQIMPESEVKISFRDRGVKYGDGAFDTTRTFHHRIFRLKEHLDRFYKTLRYLRIDPGVGQAELARITDDVLARNLHLLDKDDDYWVSQRVTRVEERAAVHPRGDEEIAVGAAAPGVA